MGFSVVLAAAQVTDGAVQSRIAARAAGYSKRTDPRTPLARARATQIRDKVFDGWPGAWFL